MKAQVFFLVVLLLCAHRVSAQGVKPAPTPPPEDEVVKISTSLIQIDVTATDRSGKIVRDQSSVPD